MRIILVGKAASGKDYARKLLEEHMGMQYQVSYTTRPPRANEIHEKDYFFLSESEFKTMIDQDEWYEYVVFNGWYYGTTKEQFNKSGGVFIMTPTGLFHLSEAGRKESLVFYFEIDEEIRKERIGMRLGNADSVERRLEADRQDFANFSDYDILINSPHFDLTDLADPIIEKLAFEEITEFFSCT